MRKRLLKMLLYAAVAAIILFVEVCVVDFHRDGEVLRERNYSINPVGLASYRADVYYGLEQDWNNVSFMGAGTGFIQTFFFNDRGNNEYIIRFGDQGYCLSLTPDGDNVCIAQRDSSERQIWKVERVGNSQNFLLINKSNGKVMTYEYLQKEGYYNACVKDFDEEKPSAFYMNIWRQ